MEKFESAMDGNFETMSDGVALMASDSGRSTTRVEHQAPLHAACHVPARFADAEVQRQHQSFVLDACLERLQHASHEASADNLRYIREQQVQIKQQLEEIARLKAIAEPGKERFKTGNLLGSIFN